MKIGYYLPERTLDNEELARLYPEWPAQKIRAKTGIASRHVAATEETVLDLAYAASRRLLDESAISPSVIDFILLCTQSPVYRLPSTACLLQDRLGVPTRAGALDFDLGCSGFVYGLALAKGLIKGGMAQQVLLVTAETYTKYIGEMDKATRTIFGDGAAATLVDAQSVANIGEFAFGTDGAGAAKLILPPPSSQCPEPHLVMDGPEIFNFTLDIVPPTLESVCARNSVAREDIDLYVFHQANQYMLDTIRKVNLLPKDKFYVNLEDTGNTVSSSIPIALRRAEAEGRLRPGMKVMLMGFGVGLSWGGTVITW